MLNQVIDCLGRKISNLWHSIDDKTAAKIRNMERPTTTKSLHSKLQQLNSLRPYVSKFGIIAAPLHHFTSTLYDRKQIIWSDEQLPVSAKQLHSSVVTSVF